VGDWVVELVEERLDAGAGGRETSLWARGLIGWLRHCGVVLELVDSGNDDNQDEWVQ
jgi:hypothetical protein